MATAATNTFSHYDRKEPLGSDNSTLSTQNRRFVTVNTNSTPPRPGQHLDGLYLILNKSFSSKIEIMPYRCRFTCMETTICKYWFTRTKCYVKFS
jgi:hypothetical protein